MRFHEAVLCTAAVVAPVAATVLWPVWWVPLAAVACVSLPIVRLVGYLIEHS